MNNKIEIGRWTIIQEIVTHTGQDPKELEVYKTYDLLWKRNLLRGGHAV